MGSALIPFLFCQKVYSELSPPVLLALTPTPLLSFQIVSSFYSLPSCCHLVPLALSLIANYDIWNEGRAVKRDGLMDRWTGVLTGK